MNAMILRQPRNVKERPLTFENVEQPQPGENEVLLRVHTCGVCRTDLHEVEGDLPLRRDYIIPGHEIVGEVIETGANVASFTRGDRVGVAWLHSTCGSCRHCRHDQENLCDNAEFTGYTVNGGYAEYAVAPADFCYAIPDRIDDTHAPPLLCAGIIGYRSLKLSAVKKGDRLGLYGFGGAAHIAIQVARHWGCEVYVITRSEEHQNHARTLGATWTGGPDDTPPVKMTGSIVFAPAGPVVLTALERLEKGGTVALAGIHMTPIPELDYRRHLYDEKHLRSAANNTRTDGRELLQLAAEIPIQTTVQTFPLEKANEALLALKQSTLDGAAVLSC